MTQDAMFILSLIPRISKLGDNYYLLEGIKNESVKKDLNRLIHIIENHGGHCIENPRPWGRQPWNNVNNEFFSMEGCMADLIEYILIKKN